MSGFGVPSRKRTNRIVALLELLDERGHLPLSSLAELLDASEATIRRDVALLAAQGLVERTHGAVRAVHGDLEVPVALRDARNRDTKARIAGVAATLVPAGRHTVGLTGGTTTGEVVHALASRTDLTIITNSLSIGLRAAEHGRARVLIGGGMLRSNSLELVGQLAEATLRTVDIDTAVVGADGISAHGGLTTHDETEARINHTLIERAARVIAVVDSSKAGRVTRARMADLAEIDVLVTDSGCPDGELEQFRSAGVELHVVPPSRTGPRGARPGPA
ncbi:DeoR family transcriptional regulator [Knoellia koreensis]|uniref:DeoR family transcriptional regulator n=1 Tax=Knoellia koreensis TaxID=2730921 RepID=UPI00197FA70B